MDIPDLNRRHFLRLGAGVIVVGLGACSTGGGRAAPLDPVAPGGTSSSTGSTPAGSAPGSVPAASTTVAGGAASSAGRRLVLVQLNGGNDGLNTVVPVDGRYRDARPTLAIAENTLVALDGTTDVALHPSLAPLVPMWKDGHLALVRGIGFQDPNRSHFVSMDRWWRADDVNAPGWLGRVLDELPAEPTALYATSFGGGTPVLAGAQRQGASVSSPAGFRFDALSADVVRTLSAPPSTVQLVAAAQHAFAGAVAAVSDFDAAMKATQDDASDDDDREGGATIAGGLALAARLLASDVGTRIVVVSAAGFDTHSGQAATQTSLLADFAKGVTAFFAAAEAAHLDVLLVTTSEFGRRVQENGSGGTDHGAGNVSFAVGPGVKGGIYGEVDLGNLLDGDVRPTVDPRTLYTAALDWIGADAAKALGKRYDDVRLLV